ncbi:MAG: hypothetical protein JJT75_07375 [Opitutales bacterium]|nr:hypothetical protein [Opitutales bacterium]
MKTYLSLVTFLSGSAALLVSSPPPTADSVNSGLRVDYDAATEAFHLVWWSTEDHFYFIVSVMPSTVGFFFTQAGLGSFKS